MNDNLLNEMRAKLDAEFQKQAPKYHEGQPRHGRFSTGEGANVKMTAEGTALILVGFLGNGPAGTDVRWTFDGNVNTDLRVRFNWARNQGYTGKIEFEYTERGTEGESLHVKRIIPAGWTGASVFRILEKLLTFHCGKHF